MVTLTECTTFAGLISNEMVLGVTPSAKHRVLLSGYILNLWRGPKTVRRMMVADIRMWRDLGMPEHAADLLIVLRQFISDYPESRIRVTTLRASYQKFLRTRLGACKGS